MFNGDGLVARAIPPILGKHIFLPRNDYFDMFLSLTGSLISTLFASVLVEKISISPSPNSTFSYSG